MKKPRSQSNMIHMILLLFGKKNNWFIVKDNIDMGIVQKFVKDDGFSKGF